MNTVIVSKCVVRGRMPALRPEDAMDVGLIGLGRMGSGIAKSLLRAGHRVTVYNRTRERAEALRKDGAAVAGSVAEACRGDAVLTMLADDAAVEAVIFGDSGVLKALPRGSVHVSLSTISVALSDRLAAEHVRVGQEFVAAPVFGRPEAAEAGKLAIVAAGPKAAVDRCKPLWDAMGQKLLVIGEQQSKANVVKLTEFLDRDGAGIARGGFGIRAQIWRGRGRANGIFDQHAFQRAGVQNLWRTDRGGQAR